MSHTEDSRKQVSVRGVVQGVGFRPFVYRLAHDHNLSGWVLNHSGGVDIEVEGPPAALDAFVHDLTAQAPPLARIVAVEVTGTAPQGSDRFEIRHSVAHEGSYQLISPDIATCADCLRELWIQRTAATGTPSPTVPTAVRVSPSSVTFPTTGP